jgi:DNA-binding transcriptional MerR regulator
VSGYTVKQVAKLSGVSVRALHHYDEVGLLKPAQVGQNGYRYYGKEELLRLQQILFHRELGFALEEIKQVLDAPGFDRLAALKAHRARLAADARRYRRLVKTIDQTLAALEGATKMDDKAMYKGFPAAKQAEYEDWLVDRYGGDMRKQIDDSKARMKGWTQSDFDAGLAEIEAVEAGVAKAMAEGLPPDSDTVMALMRRHHAWVAKAWPKPPTRAAYIGLSGLYNEHPDFRARYENRAAGLTEYLQSAMKAFAEKALD